MSILRTIKRHPGTTVIIAHYGIFGVIVGLISETPGMGFVVAITGVAVMSAFITESLLGDRGQEGPHRKIQPSPRWALFVLAIGFIAQLMAGFGGSRSYAAQLGRESIAGWVSLVTPLTSWAIIGLGLVAHASSRGAIPKKTALWVIGIVCAGQYIIGLRNGLVGAATAFALLAILTLVVMGVISWRLCLVGIVALLLLWPALRESRNIVRIEAAGTAMVDTDDDPYERLRLDHQIMNAQVVRPVRDSIGEPTWTTVVRTGLLPSMVDSPRPPIDTGSRISVALGGSSTNSQSVTALGNVYVFSGWLGLIAFSSLLALALKLALRRSTAWSIALFALIYYSQISLSASYPDGVVRLLQGMESLIFLMVLHEILCGINSPRSPKGLKVRGFSEGGGPKRGRAQIT